MKQASSKFLVLLALLLTFFFGIHLFVLHSTGNPLFQNKIIVSYCVNYLLAIIVLIAVEKNLKSHSAQAGFVFMAGSGLKFLLFFLFFYPSYKADGKMSILEFTSFFIPYAICLITEVIHLSKQLNNRTS